MLRRPAELVDVLRRRGVDVPPDLASEPDPLEVLRRTAALGDWEMTRAVEDALCAAERRAVESAAPTPYGREVIVAARQAGMLVAAVSNNSDGAMIAYSRRIGSQHTFLPWSAAHTPNRSA